MDTNSIVQDRPVQPAPLTLTLDRVLHHIATITGPHKQGWNGEDHDDLLTALFPEMRNRDGHSAKFTSEQENVLRLIFRPTEALQRTVLRQTINAAGYTLTEDAEAVLAMLFGLGQFGKFLAENNNPATGKPFITENKRKGAKKKTFDALLKSAVKNPNEPPPPAPASEITDNTAETTTLEGTKEM